MTALYKKVGRRYEYVGEERFILPYTPAWYLVHVHKPGQSIYHQIDPARAEVRAAIEEARDAMMKALAVARTPTPDARRHPTAIEQEAYAAYCAVLGEEKELWTVVPSDWDIVDAAIHALDAIKE